MPQIHEDVLARAEESRDALKRSQYSYEEIASAAMDQAVGLAISTRCWLSA